MKAIITKYLGATSTRGGRIKAYAHGVKPLTISYPDQLRADGAHRLAATLLCERQGWDVKLNQGTHPDGQQEVFVMEDKSIVPSIDNPPAKFVLYGKGPLKVVSNQCSADIAVWSELAEAWRFGYSGNDTLCTYALRIGSEIEIANR